MQSMNAHLQAGLDQLKADGLYKAERIIKTPQRSAIQVLPDEKVLNFCANNYLGLSDHPELIKTAQHALDTYGFGLSSVRFICGTQTIHKTLEEKLSAFFGFDACILYSSCFDANGGLFECLLTAEDAIISDALNHASIIDGIRLCKAKRYRYKNNDMADLEAQLQAADQAGARYKMIATDGVFSMDGIIANLSGVCDLAEKYGAMVMVDDSHASGFIGENGRGTPEYREVMGRVDILTSTFGKALGGASGGFTAASAQVVDWLRNRSRPYLFSNSVAPVIVATTIKVLDLLQSDEGAERRHQLRSNAKQFREGMAQLGFDLVPGDHPIIPVMLYDAKVASRMADALLEKGIYVIGFSYPVVPMDQARIRVQMSAGHSAAQIDQAVDAFGQVGKAMGIIT